MIHHLDTSRKAFLLVQNLQNNPGYLHAGQHHWSHLMEQKYYNWTDVTANAFPQEKLLLNPPMSCMLKQMQSKDFSSHSVLLEIQYRKISVKCSERCLSCTYCTCCSLFRWDTQEGKKAFI